MSERTSERTIDTTSWPGDLRETRIELEVDEDVIRIDSDGGPRWAFGVGPGVLILTNHRLLYIQKDRMTSDEIKEAFPTVGSRVAIFWPPWRIFSAYSVARVREYPLTNIERVRTSLGANFRDWLLAIALLPPIAPLTAHLLLTRRLGIDYTDDEGKTKAMLIYVIGPRDWVEDITKALPTS